MFFPDFWRTARIWEVILGNILKNSIARRLVKNFWKSIENFLTYGLSKSRLVFWDHDNHSVALDSGYCRPSGDVISSYSDDLMSRSPSMKVMDKVKGHRSRSYRQFQGHWPRRFRLIMLLAITYVRLWRHRVNHPILISRSKVMAQGQTWFPAKWVSRC